jgi:NAD(P)-dependent dehydrogenase (short-subunit alcohol dehydrogenase family)
VVLITGAATGIGRAVTIGFASRGAKVAIGDIKEEAARETLDLAARAGADVLFVRTNVSSKPTSRISSGQRSNASAGSTVRSTTPDGFAIDGGRRIRDQRRYDDRQIRSTQVVSAVAHQHRTGCELPVCEI